MLDALFQRPHHIRRLRANPLGAILDPFADHLLRCGYTTNFVHQLLRAVEHYGHWMGASHDPVTADEVTAASARRFLHEHLPICSCAARFSRSLIPNRAAINHLLRMLAAQDPARLLPPPSRHGPILAEYDDYLRQTCGLAEQTRIYRLRNARQFLERHCGDSALTPADLRPSDLQDYFRCHAEHLKPGSVAVLASSLRSFLRFLTLSHGFDPSLAAAVPSMPQWPVDRLPRSLSDADLRAVLSHFDTPHRDRPARPGDDAVHERPGAPRQRGRRPDPRRHRLASRRGSDPGWQRPAGSLAADARIIGAGDRGLSPRRPPVVGRSPSLLAPHRAGRYPGDSRRWSGTCFAGHMPWPQVAPGPSAPMSCGIRPRPGCDRPATA